MVKFNIVVASDDNGGIGLNGDLPWHIPEELAWFKILTTRVDDLHKRNAVIMGRNTWESLPEKYKPLPNRFNMVLTSDIYEVWANNKSLFLENKMDVMSSFDEALVHISNMNNIETVFVIGGAQLYETALNHLSCDRIFRTHVLGDFDCDKFFNISKDFELIYFLGDTVDFQIEVYKRILDD